MTPVELTEVESVAIDMLSVLFFSEETDHQFAVIQVESTPWYDLCYFSTIPVPPAAQFVTLGALSLAIDGSHALLTIIVPMTIVILLPIFRLNDL